jgi:hypothetical protein
MKIIDCDDHAVYERFTHRTTQCKSFVELPREVSINGVRVMCSRLTIDDCWWIIASSLADDNKHTDVGPFDTADDAVVYMKLLADPVKS